MKFLIHTDLEGVAGTDSFSQTRTDDTGPQSKGPSMKQLGREVNACVRGIHSIHPEAAVDVIDAHGNGGLFPEDLENCHPLPRKPNLLRSGVVGDYAALFIVGQHAMAGTVDAPLCHTFVSRSVL